MHGVQEYTTKKLQKVWLRCLNSSTKWGEIILWIESFSWTETETIRPASGYSLMMMMIQPQTVGAIITQARTDKNSIISPAQPW